MSLFAHDGPARNAQLDAACDTIQERFGTSALQRGSGLLHQALHKPMPRPSDQQRKQLPSEGV